MIAIVDKAASLFQIIAFARRERLDLSVSESSCHLPIKRIYVSPLPITQTSIDLTILMIIQ